MTVGDRIRLRRLELGLTQEELAHKLGYASRVSVNKYELERNMPLSKVEKFAKALECSPSFLMGWEEEQQGTDEAQALNLILDARKDDKKFTERMLQYAKFLLSNEPK